MPVALVTPVRRRTIVHDRHVRRLLLRDQGLAAFGRESNTLVVEDDDGDHVHGY